MNTILFRIARRISAGVQARGRGIHVTSSFDLQSTNTTDLLAATANALGWSSPEPLQLDRLILSNVDNLEWPRSLIFVIHGTATQGDVARLNACAMGLAEATKNTRGPVTCVVLLPWQSDLPQGVVPEVWQPLQPYVRPLPLRSSRPNCRESGFDRYLSLRIYWEAAGRGGQLGLLEELLNRAGRYVRASDPDARIDRDLDSLVPAAGRNCLVFAELFDRAFNQESGSLVLRTGHIYVSRLPLQQLLGSGLAWCPPGAWRSRISPLAAAHLTADREFRARWGLDDEAVSSFRRSVRENNILASWVLGLTALVERELLTICRRDTNLREKLDRLGLGERLEEEQSRAAHDFAYSVKDEPIEYASFYDLQMIVTQTELSLHFPASTQLLHQIRHARNLSAHGHAVAWRAVEAVLEVIEMIVRSQ